MMPSRNVVLGLIPIPILIPDDHLCRCDFYSYSAIASSTLSTMESTFRAVMREALINLDIGRQKEANPTYTMLP